jgi:hypothetical protein
MDLVQRTKDIMLKPKETWPVIKNESTTIKELYTSYAAILAVIPAAATFIGFSLIGISTLGFHYRLPLGTGLGRAVVSYVLSLVGLYVVAVIIDALAPTFGSPKNLLNAFKVVVYSWTPGWLAGILIIIPMLSPISLLISLYGLYLFYLGLPILMETPQEKTMGYVIVTIVVTIVVFAVIGAITSTLFRM